MGAREAAEQRALLAVVRKGDLSSDSDMVSRPFLIR